MGGLASPLCLIFPQVTVLPHLCKVGGYLDGGKLRIQDHLHTDYQQTDTVHIPYIGIGCNCSFLVYYSFSGYCSLYCWI